MEFNPLSRADALEKLFAAWNVQAKTETVPLEEAAGRVTAETLRSRFTIPAVRASSRDGIAVRSADFARGIPDASHWQAGRDYVRADTGDDFDDRFDTVIQIEDVTFNETGGFSLPGHFTLTQGMGVNGPGDMILEGEVILEEGLPIRACDLGALARGGIWDVPVRKKPSAAFIPTGSELIPVRQTPSRGKNIDTNSVMARQMLLEMGAIPLIFPIVKDHPDSLKAALREGLATSDIVVINGGSSKGAEDYNARLLAEAGTVICHGVNAAPGFPMCLAVVDGKPVINLPGPMLAAWFGMDWCVRAVVSHALGVPAPRRQRVKAVLTEQGGPPNRTFAGGFEFLSRIRLTRTPSGYEAWPVPFDRVEGRRTQGFMNGQCALSESRRGKGSEVEVELLYGEEYY